MVQGRPESSAKGRRKGVKMPYTETSARTRDELKTLLMQAYQDAVPRYLSILVHLAEDFDVESPGACVAMCLQYPVSCRAETLEEAVGELMIDLRNYLSHCEETGRFAPYWPNMAYYKAFELGKEKTFPGVAGVRISRELLQYLGVPEGRDLVSVVRLKDIRKTQEQAGGKAIEKIFRAA